jgi:MFS family permease
MNRNLILLALCQGLFLTNNVTFIAVNGLVGLALAPAGWMATLPVMGYVVGGALSTGLVARTQRRYGRRASFQFGLAVAFLSCLLCAYATAQRDFPLLIAATVVAGYYSANGQLYRFAAVELADEAFRDQAVSLVLAGGLIGGIVGPNLAKFSRDLLPTPFVAAYLALTVIAVLGFILMHYVRFPPVPERASGADMGRPLAEIMRQPVFIVAAAGAALSYGVMSLLMAASPLAMQICGYPFSDAALVLEWHVIGMFAPGFFTGRLIKKFGALRVMGVGVLFNLACIAVALAGVALSHFVIALFLLGVGWNFLFTGSTTLALRAWTAEEKDRGQAAINFLVFATMALTSFASGALVTTQGWGLLNAGSLLPVAFTAAALLWLAAVEKSPPPQTA